MISNMPVKNSTNNKIIQNNAKFCNSVFSRFKGLMFSRKQNIALIFKFSRESKIALHQCFVFYSIDVLFLDKNRIVVDIKENFKPFTFYTSKKKAVYAIELPEGAINHSKTKIGDRIKF